MMSQPITTEELARARRVLIRRDPVLGAIIKRYGECRLGARTDRAPAIDDIYCSLIHAIVSQQLSTKAAATIYARFRGLLPDGAEPTADAVLPLSDETLRGVGLSRQKIGYLRDLSQKMIDGSLRLDALPSLADEAVVEMLTEIKGIGRWTAEMILIFRLLRPDILPVGDLAIVKAIQKAYGLRNPPDARRMLKIAEPWRPYRSVASWYLWASLDVARARHKPMTSKTSGMKP
jgi:DNA-3-methyladenine glycosylase II